MMGSSRVMPPWKTGALAGDRWALLAVWFFSIVLVTYPVFDFDLYWHLANGREMVNTATIVSREVFSYTHFGEKFANHEWLGQIIFYLVWDHLGPYGLLGFKLLLVALMVWTLYRTLRNENTRSGIAALLCVLAVFAGINRYHERPELFSLFNTALLGFILYGFRSNRLPRRILWLIPLILVAWDWLHGAVYGLTFLTLFVAGENAKRWLPRQQPLASAELKYLNRCFALTMLAMLVNPLGLRSYGIFVGYVIGEADFNQVITEFTPVNWDEFKVFILLLVWAVLLALRNWRRLDVTHLLLMVVFGGAALRFNRVTGVAAIVLVPVIASLLGTSIRQARGKLEASLHTATLAVAGVLLLGDGYLVKFGGTEAPPENDKYYYMKMYDLGFDYSVDENFYPVGAVNFIKEQGITGHMYNSGNLGGYLSYRITPERRIFQYNMGRVFGDPFYFVSHPDNLAKWNIDYAIIDTESELGTLFPERDWAEVYRDEAAILVVRRTPQNAALIRQYENFFFSPVLSDASLRERANDPEVLPRLAEEMGDHLAYRQDERIAVLWAEILMAHPDLENRPQIRQLLAQALRYNHAAKLVELAGYAHVALGK
ncbi:MAG: hypothetical protein HY938_08605 [Nitrosomonadales bacterium]|nr:hypothetical protein [Nitrosomonadales bacterium]